MRNYWGGSIELTEITEVDEISRDTDVDRASISHPDHRTLDEIQRSWLLRPTDDKKKKTHVDLGCVVCSPRALKWNIWTVVILFFGLVLPIVIVKSLPKPKSPPPQMSNYSNAVTLALKFFDAQKSGKLPKNNFNVSWRGDSGLHDGMNQTDFPWGLVGGYYDAGDNTKIHFPMSFAMTMMSWSVIEYEAKYRAINQYDHVRDLIRWGTDYLLLTFNSTATRIDEVCSQVGGSMNGSHTPNDHYCWQHPEDMDYPRHVQIITSGPDLAGEMASALAAASIVFRDDPSYSRKLVMGAETVLFAFAREKRKRNTYSRGKPFTSSDYNSTGSVDEITWGSGWLYYATRKALYLSLATDTDVPTTPDLRVLSWDNKWPGAMLLLTRMRLFMNPGYPYEEKLHGYHTATELTMCSYLKRYDVFNFTKGGLIELSRGKPKNLQYVANAAFLASVYADYLSAIGAPGWNCGPTFIPISVLKDFAASQINYILGNNPMNLSYVVGYGPNYPKHVHHRGASIPSDVRPSCTGGWKWRDALTPNPNRIDGAMVGGPDRFDDFKDVRRNYSYTEPTLAGNAGLVAALISLAPDGGFGVDQKAIFSAVLPKLSTTPPPPPAPWRPGD